ncbi:MAG: LytTR family DNA-binding domain-containing protein [bacterium]
MSPRVLIADDEPPARVRVRAMLASHPTYEIISEVGDGAAAVDVMLSERPDIVFLDIRMPELDGFEVIDALISASGAMPAIVFVTAYDAFAVKAFEVGALDYLLKPFDQPRFDRALESAAERIELRALRAAGGTEAMLVDPGIDSFLRTVRSQRARPSRFLVRRGRQMQFVRAEEIDWLDAQGNYVRLHIGGRAHLLRDTMTAMETKLDPVQFVRVHRSAIVNIDRVAHIEPHVHGEFEVTMRDGARLTTSAAHSAKLRALLR